MREHHHITTSIIVRDLAGIVSGDDKGVPLPLSMGWIKQELGTHLHRGKAMRTTITVAANYQMMTIMTTLTGRVPRVIPLIRRARRQARRLKIGRSCVGGEYILRNMGDVIVDNKGGHHGGRRRRWLTDLENCIARQ